MSYVCVNEMSGLQGRVKIMTMPYKKDNTLCSPTSALEMGRMLSCLGKKLRNLSSGCRTVTNL
jgi:hypothetical protein